jgi:hypothetical protein
MPGNPDVALASMGVYVFNGNFLFDQLARDAADDSSSHDFGKDIIPLPGRQARRHLRPPLHRQLRQAATPAPRPTGATSARSTPTGRPTSTSPASSPRSTSTTRTGASGPTRSSSRPPSSCTTRTPAAAGDQLDGVRRLHHLRRRDPPLAPVLQRPRQLLQPPRRAPSSSPTSSSTARPASRVVIDRGVEGLIPEGLVVGFELTPNAGRDDADRRLWVRHPRTAASLLRRHLLAITRRTCGAPLIAGHTPCPEGQRWRSQSTGDLSNARTSTRSSRLRPREPGASSREHEGSHPLESGAPTLRLGRRGGRWRGTQAEGPRGSRAAAIRRLARCCYPLCSVTHRRSLRGPSGEHVPRGYRRREGPTAVGHPVVRRRCHAPRAIESKPTPSSADDATRPALSSQSHTPRAIETT